MSTPDPTSQTWHPMTEAPPNRARVYVTVETIDPPKKRGGQTTTTRGVTRATWRDSFWQNENGFTIEYDNPKTGAKRRVLAWWPMPAAPRPYEGA